MRRFLAACLLLLLAGCGLISGLIETEDALESAGYANASVDFEESSASPGPVITVTYDSTAVSLEQLRGEAVEIASIVWQKAPVRISELWVSSNTGEVRTPTTFSRGQLEQMFGPRPPGLKEQDFEDIGRGVVRGFVAVGIVLFVVVAGVVVLIVVLVRRSRRTQPVPSYAGGWSSAPGGPMWGQPQQPWGAPPPQPPGSWGPPPPPAQPGSQPPGDPDDPWAAPPG